MKNAPKRAVLFTKSGMFILLNQRAIQGNDMYVVSHIGYSMPLAGIPSEWTYYWLKTLDFKDLIHATTLPSLQLSKVQEILTPLPPLPEQRRIVAKIEELFTKLDADVEDLKKAKAELKRYRQSVLKHAFEGKLTAEWREANKDKIEPAAVLLERIREERKKALGKKYKELPPVDTSSLPDLPEGWVWTRIGDIVEKIANGITERQDKSGQGTPVTRIETISDGVVDLTRVGYLQNLSQDIIEQYQLSKGDILFSHINSDLHLGKTAVFNIENLILLHGMNLLLIRLFKSYVSPYFFHYLCIYYRFSGNFIAIAQHAVNQSSINQTKMNNLIIPLPPFVEQQKIVEEIERHLSVADAVGKVIEHGLKQSDRLRQSILKKAFEGKLVPQDPSDEPAEKLLERIKAEKAKLEASSKAQRKISIKKSRGGMKNGSY